MEKTPIFDEAFKQKVSDSCEKIKDTLSDAVLTDEGRLDTEKIGNAARDAAQKAEGTVREGYQRFHDNFVREDGSLDQEKLRDAAGRTYRKAGRMLATGMTRLAKTLSDHFGTNTQNTEVIDSQLAEEEVSQEM